MESSKVKNLERRFKLYLIAACTLGLLLLGCTHAYALTYKACCRHKVVTVAMILAERGYPVRIWWGPTTERSYRKRGYHAQTQGFKEGKWCWASLVDGGVDWTKQDYWFKPKVAYTLEEYLAFWFRVWRLQKITQ